MTKDADREIFVKVAVLRGIAGIATTDGIVARAMLLALIRKPVPVRRKKKEVVESGE